MFLRILRHVFVLSLCAFFSLSHAVTQPKLKASAWVLMEAQSGNIIAENNPHAKLPPASMTKLMTAYVVYDALEDDIIALDDIVTVSETAHSMGGSKMFLRQGEKVTVQELIKGLVIVSGNDASVALAEHVYADEAVFVEKMNEMAEKLGMENTHFENATGWPVENHYSTPYDMAVLARAIIQEFPQYYATYKEKEFTHDGVRQLNRNLLLWRDQSVDGLKTGHTDEAGYCLVASGKRNEQRLISAVFNTDSKKARAEQSQRLLNYGFRFFTTEKIYPKESAISQSTVEYGAKKTVNVGRFDDVYLTYPKEQVENIVATIENIEPLQAPIQRGQQVGTLTVTAEQGMVLLQEPVFALEDVNEANFFLRIWQWILSLFS
ncbi:MAG: D-alanyl-D-alanine carboxypeptidase family protein [Pseudomonadota bacterium]|nr:D-alanyl-D-alanine carboxypeptidase family protein [Pseudomonadota bacterium]